MPASGFLGHVYLEASIKKDSPKGFEDSVL